MKQYQHQKFLLQCAYSEFDIKAYSRNMPADTPLYLRENDLFDYPVYRRKIPLSILDGNVDVKEDFDAFVKKVKYVDELYLVDDRKCSESPFVQKHALAMKKAFLWHFLQAGISCYIAK